jgi:CheY-like chemotaxis protein
MEKMQNSREFVSTPQAWRVRDYPKYHWTRIREVACMDEKMSILIADDNNSLLQTLSLIMTHKGFAVTTASDGIDAVDKARETSFDVILMDIRMPRMDGVQAYKRIKHIQPNAVVMMMTAYALDDLIQEAFGEGAQKVFYKPFDIDDVLSAISRLD